WGGLIDTLRHNLNRQQARVRVFELGRVYASQAEQPMKLGSTRMGWCAASPHSAHGSNARKTASSSPRRVSASI
ncbi:MAG: hypothetical protein M1449_02735, partial [Candidatus Thermoplasmatota archaeon]|nr:hypothetical protein [Candidatus Thermoplasmatota archaeon]